MHRVRAAVFDEGHSYLLGRWLAERDVHDRLRVRLESGKATAEGLTTLQAVTTSQAAATLLADRAQP